MYTSKALTNIQLFIEFIFESMRERSEPLVALFELTKLIFKLKEYSSLLYQEKINMYIELE